MEKNAKKPNEALYIVLSIVIACALWLYVRNVDNPEQKVTLANIPVTVVGEERLNENDLMIVSGKEKLVTLQVQGRWRIVSQLTRNNVTIQVDVSRITSPGEHNMAYDILWPDRISSSSVSVLNRSPVYVQMTVDQRVRRSVEVRGVFSGSLAEGYQAGEFTFRPDMVDVSGLETDVARVAYAKVELKEDLLDHTVEDDMPYVLIGRDGDPVSIGTLETYPATVRAVYPVTRWKEVPLTVDFVPGGGATAETVKGHYTISPETIMLAGSEEELAAYSAINLGSIDLAKVIGTSEFRFAIPYAQDVENVSGVQEAVVSVTVTGLKTTLLETENIEVIGAPAGVKVAPVTKHLQVQVRGTSEALDLVLPQYLRVVVDLTGQSLPAGQNVVTAKVSLDGVSGAGVIGDYKVAISLSDSIG